MRNSRETLLGFFFGKPIYFRPMSGVKCDDTTGCQEITDFFYSWKFLERISLIPFSCHFLFRVVISWNCTGIKMSYWVRIQKMIEVRCCGQLSKILNSLNKRKESEIFTLIFLDFISFKSIWSNPTDIVQTTFKFGPIHIIAWQ